VVVTDPDVVVTEPVVTAPSGANLIRSTTIPAAGGAPPSASASADGPEREAGMVPSCALENGAARTTRETADRSALRAADDGSRWEKTDETGFSCVCVGRSVSAASAQSGYYGAVTPAGMGAPGVPHTSTRMSPWMAGTFRGTAAQRRTATPTITTAPGERAPVDW
jgi:hypothetical protein